MNKGMKSGMNIAKLILRFIFQIYISWRKFNFASYSGTVKKKN